MIKDIDNCRNDLDIYLPVNLVQEAELIMFLLLSLKFIIGTSLEANLIIYWDENFWFIYWHVFIWDYAILYVL